MTFEEMQSIMQSVVISQRETQATLRETQHLAQSIARGVQAMQDRDLTDELKREEERAEHQAQMAELRHISYNSPDRFMEPKSHTVEGGHS